MSILDSFFDRAEAIIDRRNEEQMTARFGGIQKCPWCRQWAQSEDGWKFAFSPDQPQNDILTCGVCGGTSLWHFAMGMLYVGPLSPPTPAAWSSSAEAVRT